MISKAYSSLALVGMLTLVPLVSSAQVTPPPGGQRQRMEMEQRLQLGFQRSVQAQLRLDPEQLQSVQAIMQSFQEERRALNRAQASARYRLRDPALPDMGEDEAMALIQELVDLQQRELELYKAEQGELLKVMSPVQLLGFYRMRDDLGQRVQELRQGRGPGGGQGGGQGGPGGPSAPLGGRGPGGGTVR